VSAKEGPNASSSSRRNHSRVRHSVSRDASRLEAHVATPGNLGFVVPGNSGFVVPGNSGFVVPGNSGFVVPGNPQFVTANSSRLDTSGNAAEEAGQDGHLDRVSARPQ
jgi:hypothetical protein